MGPRPDRLGPECPGPNLPTTFNETVALAMALRNANDIDLRSLTTSLSWKRPRIKPRRRAPAKGAKVAKQHILTDDNCNYSKAFTFRVGIKGC